MICNWEKVGGNKLYITNSQPKNVSSFTITLRDVIDLSENWGELGLRGDSREAAKNVMFLMSCAMSGNIFFHLKLDDLEAFPQFLWTAWE